MATIKLKEVTESSFSYQIDSDTQQTVVCDLSGKNNGGAVTIPGYGTFAWNSEAKVTFTAVAGLAGTVAIDISAVSSQGGIVTDKSAVVDVVDFSKTTKGIIYTGVANDGEIKGGAGDDSLSVGAATSATITAGAGNDTINTGASAATISAGSGNDVINISGTAANEIFTGEGSDTVNVASTVANSSVTLGAGSDIISLAASDASVALSGYNYFEGDAIQTAAGVAKFDLAADGKFSVSIGSNNNNVVAEAPVAAVEGWYGLKVDDGEVVDYFTAAAGSSNVKLNLGKSNVSNVVDAQAVSGSADITLGFKDDTVNLGTGKADTITIVKGSGTDVINNFENASDVLVVEGGKIGKSVTLSAGNSSDLQIAYAAGSTVSLVGANGTTTPKVLNFSDGTTTQKVAFDVTAGAQTISLDDAKDADIIVGKTDTTIVVDSETHLHEDKFVGDIRKISVAGSLDKTINLTGNNKLANEIDASAASVGVQIWGYSKEGDKISLGSAQDTVWFGANDGTDTIANFSYGTGTDDDVLYLIDTKTLKDIEVKAATSGNNAQVVVGKAVASITSASSQNDAIQVKLADGETYKVAGNFNNQTTVNLNTDEVDGLVFYALDKDAKSQISLSGSKDFLVNATYTDAYTTGAEIASVNASVATGNLTIAAVANISTGSGTNNVWNYGVDTETNVVLAAGAGTDTVWFADGIDTSVNVSNFDTDDTLYLVTSKGLKNITDTYDFKVAASGATVINGATSQISLAGATGLSLKDAEGNIYKAAGAAVGTALNFASDVNVYFGSDKISVAASVEGSYTVRVGENSRGVDTSESVYISDSVTEFDASQSAAEFVIAGNSQANTTIKGGLTKNDLYGGGVSSDELWGNAAAVDTFWFGTGDGVDTINQVNDDDTVNLWNVNDADIKNISVELETGKAKISLSDGSVLNIDDANNAIAGGLTFTSAQGTAYTYDSESKKLVEKKA